MAVTATGVLSGLTLTQITANGSTACVLASTGAAYCWGLGTSGQLGNGLSVNKLVPVSVSTSGALSGVTLTQLDVGQLFTCGLSSAGAAYCWGDNTSGELGNGLLSTSSTPQAVTTTGTPLSGVTLTQVNAGAATACAVGSTGAAYCWGNGTSGQLGNGGSVARTTAQAVTTTGTLSGGDPDAGQRRR